MNKEQKISLDELSPNYIFKDIVGEDEVWLMEGDFERNRLLNFLKTLPTNMIEGCLNQNPSDLMYTFDLRYLDYYAKDNNQNNDLIGYLKSLPGYGDSENFKYAQTSHLFTVILFSSLIYCKKRNLKITANILPAIQYQSLTEVFNIIDQEYPENLSYESWFRGMLSH